MKKWLGLKILLFVLLSTVILIGIDVGFSAFSNAEKGCYAWTASSGFNCSVSFLDMGLASALGRHMLFSAFFESNMYNAKPNMTMGILILSAWIAAYLILLAILFKIVISISASFRGVETEVKPKIKSSVKSLDFILVVGILIALGFALNLFLNTQNKKPVSTKVGSLVHTNTGKKEGISLNANPNLESEILSDVSEGKITALDLDHKLTLAVQNKGIDERTMSKLFDISMRDCRNEYTQIIIKFPMQPSPKDYDKKYMRSQYESLINPNCEKIYKLMGWNEGCEIELTDKICDQYTQYETKYWDLFKANSSKLTCDTNTDCFFSTPGTCGKVMLGSKKGFSSEDILSEEKMRCPHQKLRAYCSHENKSFVSCAEQIQSFTAECKNSVCTLIRQL